MHTKTVLLDKLVFIVLSPNRTLPYCFALYDTLSLIAGKLTKLDTVLTFFFNIVMIVVRHCSRRI